MRPIPRLDFSESQYRDQVRDLNYLSLIIETKSETADLVETESLAILCSEQENDCEVAGRGVRYESLKIGGPQGGLWCILEYLSQSNNNTPYINPYLKGISCEQSSWVL